MLTDLSAMTAAERQYPHGAHGVHPNADSHGCEPGGSPCTDTEAAP